MKVGYLAFEATRTSATDVDFPMQHGAYRKGTHRMTETHYEQHDLKRSPTGGGSMRA